MVVPIVAAMIASLAMFPSPASAAEVIQPGVPIRSGNSGCTLSWIFDEIVPTGESRAPRVFASTAGHCVSGAGAEVFLTDGSLTGTQLARIGKVVIDAEPSIDYALITIDPGRHGKVRAAMKGHPAIPRGVSRSTTLGDTIQFSGYGTGMGFTQQSQEERVGFLAYNDDCEHFVYGAISPGDSGGPVANVTDGNKAVGIVTTGGVNVSVPAYVHAGEGGVSLPCVFKDAESRGIRLKLRSVP